MTGPEEYLSRFTAEFDARTERDAKKSRAARDEGMQRAADGSTPEWQAAARKTVLEVARRLPEFTTDDVWAAGLPMPRESRAMGPVMRALAADGKIEITDRTQRSVRVVAHSGPKQVWRSLVHGGTA